MIYFGTVWILYFCPFGVSTIYMTYIWQVWVTVLIYVKLAPNLFEDHHFVDTYSKIWVVIIILMTLTPRSLLGSSFCWHLTWDFAGVTILLRLNMRFMGSSFGLNIPKFGVWVIILLTLISYLGPGQNFVDTYHIIYVGVIIS